MSSIKQECSVCCYPKSKFVKCLYCNEKACTKCYETYNMEQIEDRCMFCKNEWNFEFMQNNFTKTFMNKMYKQKKEKLLLEREKSLLPETQQRIEEEKRKDKINLQIQRINLLIKEKIAIIRRIEKGGLVSDTDKELRTKNMKELNELNVTSARLQSLVNIEKKEEEKVVSRIACSKEDCRGFLNKDDNNLRCGMCDTIHCIKCRVITGRDDEHKCDKNTLETIKMLEKETKPCPKCNVPIFKIEGCDQMWCVKCHTAFSWKKGTIETGRIHNPHYWKYLQDNGRDLDQVRQMNGQHVRGAGRCQDLRDIVIATGNLHLTHISQLFHHFEYAAITRYQETNNDANYELRKSYLNKQIDEKKFVRTLHMRHKRSMFERELNQIARMMIDVSKDILISRFNQLGRLNLLISDFDDCYEEIKQLSIYARQQIQELYKRFNYTLCRMIDCALFNIYKHTQSKKLQHYYERDEEDVPLAELGNIIIQ